MRGGRVSKNSATVPCPVCEPITGPIYSITIFVIPVFSMIFSFTNSASSRQSAWEMNTISILQAGNDILHICFSSGLSSTYQNVLIAVEELKKEFPERKIYMLDSKCASSGEGLLVYLDL